MIKTYEIHEFAALVPMASEAEQVALNEDIKDNGLREPIILWQGKIVDGRCRQQACVYAGERIRIKELDTNLTDYEVKITVKSLNTRRNLTITQKVMSACKTSIDPKNTLALHELATSWGIKETLLKNARFIAKHAPHLVDPLFDGASVSIISSNGEETLSNKVSAVYASIKREQQQVVKDEQHGWSENSYIKTQAGKDWFYEQSKVGVYTLNAALAELANYKFQIEGNK